jgi:hypothetical protein
VAPQSLLGTIWEPLGSNRAGGAKVASQSLLGAIWEPLGSNLAGRPKMAPQSLLGTHLKPLGLGSGAHFGPQANTFTLMHPEFTCQGTPRAQICPMIESLTYVPRTNMMCAD